MREFYVFTECGKRFRVRAHDGWGARHKIEDYGYRVTGIQPLVKG